MGSATSEISIQFNGEQPFVAGQHVTGTVMFNNTLKKGVKFRVIYAQLVGEVIYTTKQYNGSGYYHATHRAQFFQQLTTLEEKQEDFTLESDYCSWPVLFSLPSFLPPSLDRLSTHGPYVRYQIHVVFERPDKFRMNICQKFPILIIASPTFHSQASYLPAEAENKNHSDVSVHASLADQKGSFAPGDRFLLNIELNNPNHKTIKCISIDLVQHRRIGMAEPCEQIIPLVDLPSVREFSGEYHCKTLELTIPDDDRIIRSFYYMPPEFSGKPVAVEYTLRLQVKTHGFFKDFIVNIPIVLHSTEICMEPHYEEEAPPPPYDFPIATY